MKANGGLLLKYLIAPVLFYRAIAPTRRLIQTIHGNAFAITPMSL